MMVSSTVLYKKVWLGVERLEWGNQFRDVKSGLVPAGGGEASRNISSCLSAVYGELADR
jgi:hypothetical protein